jgi:hypothetical protein
MDDHQTLSVAFLGKTFIKFAQFDITPPFSQTGRGHRDKIISNRYQFHAKMSAKSTIFLRQATCLHQWCRSNLE